MSYVHDQQTDPPALAAAQQRMADTRAALLAALQVEPGPRGQGPVVQLAQHMLEPFAHRRPWTLVALAAAAGALLATRRGRRGVVWVGMAATTQWLAPAHRWRGLQLLGRGLVGLLTRHREPRT